MTKLESLIKEVLELDAKATPVEWNAWVITKILEEAARPGKINEFDSALIAHYRTAAPKLARACEVLKRQRDEYRDLYLQLGGHDSSQEQDDAENEKIMGEK